MIIYLHGEDNFRSRQRLKQMVSKFKEERDPQGYNVVFLDGKIEKTDKIIQEIMAVPFLAERRMIIVENILASKDEDLINNLLELIKTNNIPESNVVLFWQGEASGKTKIVKELHENLAKQKFVQEFKLLKNIHLEKWIREKVEELGGKIGSYAVKYLVDNAGADMWVLNNLIEQVCAFKSGSEIELSDTQLFLEEKVDDNIFNLTDAIASGNQKQAFKLLSDQRRLGADDFKIFSMIVWQFRNLIKIRDLYDREDGITSDVMAKQLKMHPFVVKKNLASVKKHNLEELKKDYQKLLDIDIKTKTGQGDQSVLIDLFVGKS